MGLGLGALGIGAGGGGGSITINEIRLNTTNNYGSTNNKISRWANIEISDGGSNLTLSQSSTDGDDITVENDGLVTIAFAKDIGVVDKWAGVSVNSNELTTEIYSITASHRKIAAAINPINYIIQGSITYKASSGDVIRLHTDGHAAGTNNSNSFLHVVWQG